MAKAPAKKDVMQMLEWLVDKHYILGFTWNGMQGGSGDYGPAKQLPPGIDKKRKEYLLTQALGYVDVDKIARRYQSYRRNHVEN